MKANGKQKQQCRSGSHSVCHRGHGAQHLRTGHLLGNQGQAMATDGDIKPSFPFGSWDTSNSVSERWALAGAALQTPLNHLPQRPQDMPVPAGLSLALLWGHSCSSCSLEAAFPWCTEQTPSC